MRCSILGFNQKKLISIQTDSLKIDMQDLLLMDYIQRALSSPSLQKHLNTEDNQPYVWLQHSKILEDLPILDIKESMLKKRIAKLVDLGLIKSVKQSIVRGSKSFYTITELFEDLQKSDEESETNTSESRSVKNYTSRSVKNYTSDNKLIDNSNNNINIIITKEKKSSKPNLYTKCINLIDDYTKNQELRESLISFLDICLANSQESGRPFYSNHFKGKLNQLSRLSEDDSVRIKIVKQTLDYGWNGFYELKQSKKNVHSRLNESGAGIVPRGDKKAMKEAIENGTAEKF